MKTFPIYRNFDETQRVGTITLNDDIVLMGDECLAWQATYEDPATGEIRDEAKLLSLSLIKSKNVLVSEYKYGIEPSEIQIKLE